MDLNGVDVRQISVSLGGKKLTTVITRNEENAHMMLLVNHETGVVLQRKEGVTSAVFSSDGQKIIAGKDSMVENVLVFDLNFKLINSIKFSFPDLSDSIEIDDYRVLWVCEPFKNNYIIFVAYYCT